MTLDVGTDNETLLNDHLYVVRDFHTIIVRPSDRFRDGLPKGYGVLSTINSSTSKLDVPLGWSNLIGLLRPRRFVQLIRKYQPHCLLHFEDFGVSNAQRLLELYQNEHSVFNDDMYEYASFML